jgi:uncharacterized protein YyaL (SSP411 family)
MHRAALATYVPRRIVHRLSDGTEARLPTPLAEMVRAAAAGAAPRGYACTGTSCRMPAEGAEAWSALLAALR